jgi:hypothetical protein
MSRGTGSSARRAAASLALLVCSVGATLAAAELALRIARGDLSGRPFSGAGRLRVVDPSSRYPAEYDPLLGYRPSAGAHGTDNVWSTLLTIDADGLRENGAPRPSGRPILALGDSFTFGDEVDDGDTWPARLERRLGRPVLNGGVFGYGIDQMVLRGEQLLAGPAAAADVVILSVFPEDVLRCEFSYRYAWKPYFALDHGGLVLYDVPVPQPHQGRPGESFWRRALRNSFLADRVLRRIDPDGWGVPDSVRAHHDGAEVALRLLDRLIDGVRSERRALLLVTQWSPSAQMGQVRQLVARAHERGVTVVELGKVLEPIVRMHEIGAVFYDHGEAGVGHMNPNGNRVAAEAIATAVEALAPGRIPAP